MKSHRRMVDYDAIDLEWDRYSLDEFFPIRSYHLHWVYQRKDQIFVESPSKGLGEPIRSNRSSCERKEKTIQNITREVGRR